MGLRGKIRKYCLSPWAKSAGKVSASGADVLLGTTHGVTRAKIPIQSEASDTPGELEEHLNKGETSPRHSTNTKDPSEELTTPTSGHYLSSASETNSCEENPRTSNRADSIAPIPTESYAKLSRGEKLDILAMVIGALPCCWYLIRISLVTYIPVLVSTPRLVTTVFAVFGSPVLWLMAHAEEKLPQKIRLMSYSAYLCNWLILTLELFVGYYNCCLGLKALEPTSELAWIVVLLAAFLGLCIFIMFGLILYPLFLGELLEGADILHSIFSKD